MRIENYMRPLSYSMLVGRMEGDSGMLMSSEVINVHMCEWEGEKKGAMQLGVEQGN
jgi:hypothetical protein